MSLARLCGAASWRRWLPLAGALVIATALRAGLVREGPDAEVDAYSHFVIGRSLLAGEWRSVAVHWVWLPAWHFVNALVALAGGGVGALRWVNVALALGPPVLLARALRGGGRDPWLGPLAGALLALWPLGIALGASAQPEVSFQLGALAACALWESGRRARAGVVLAALALLRYEAWALPFAFLYLWVRSERRPRDALAWVLPGVAVVAWVALHRAQTGEWLRFVRLNHEYIRPAFSQGSLAWADRQSALDSLGWYAVQVPLSDARWIALLALPGLAWIFPGLPRAHRAVFVVLLAFVTLSWLRRENWGLARHFFVLAPWYAAGAAAAVLGLARAVTRGRFVGPAGALVAALAVALTLPPRVRELRRGVREAFVHERAAAAAVRRSIGSNGQLFCMQNTVEALSGVRHRDVWRWHPAHVTARVLRREARAHGVAVAVLPPERVDALASEGAVVERNARYAVLLVR